MRNDDTQRGCSLSVSCLLFPPRRAPHRKRFAQSLMLARWNRLSAAANRARRVRQWKKISSGERWFSGRERRSKKPVITSLCIRVTHFLFCFYSVISAKVSFSFSLSLSLSLSCLSFFSPLVIRYFFCCFSTSLFWRKIWLHLWWNWFHTCADVRIAEYTDIGKSRVSDALVLQVLSRKMWVECMLVFLNILDKWISVYMYIR